MCFLVVGLLVSGCTGSFNITKKVYDLHRQQEDKWIDELIFLGCVILPVYGIAVFADAIVVNTIEFWTGENPVILSKANTNRELLVGDAKATLTHNPDDTIKIKTGDAPDKIVILERNPSGVIAKDNNGKVVYSSIKDSSGGVSVYDGDMKLVNYHPADEVVVAR